MCDEVDLDRGVFLSTPSGWRATGCTRKDVAVFEHFYPRPPGGGRHKNFFKRRRHFYFYPRPPGGGRHIGFFTRQKTYIISIHALRVEGDNESAFKMASFDYFYPRPPGGGRRALLTLENGVVLFLSTPSGWRATTSCTRWALRASYFYPRPPGGGRPEVFGPVLGNVLFLSTPSGWRATTPKHSCSDHPKGISIHALRVEGDACPRRQYVYARDISIHALRVEGDRGYRPLPDTGYSISIHALRVEGDEIVRSLGLALPISIHALRVEGDPLIRSAIYSPLRFLSTPSGWRATQKLT